MSCQTSCTDQFNCGSVSPDFFIKRHDTLPPFKVAVSDCNGPLNLSGMVLEASMWADAKFKKDVATTDTYFCLADNIGFNQALVGDIIVVDRIRNPEQMLITGFDENLQLIQVERGYNGTPVSDYKKGNHIRIFRVLNAVASIALTYEDQLQLDGSVLQNVLVKSELVYEWSPNDTCVPGCFNFEFKLLQMSSSMSLSMQSISAIPSFVSYTPSQYGCFLGQNVVSVRRFPTNGAFIISISDTPTAETLT